MKRQSRNQQNKFSQDRTLKIESLENRNLMTVGNMMVGAIVDDNHTHVESVTIGHEKNIVSVTSPQCQAACYVPDQGKDKLDGFFTQSGSASELGSFPLPEFVAPNVKESVAILGTANGIEQARDATYEDYWDMDMSIRHEGHDKLFGQLGSVPHIEYRGALKIYNGFVVPEMPTAGTPLRGALEIYNGF